VAVYFPMTLGDFSPQYTLLSRTVPPMAPWVTFLRQLYNSTSVATADKGEACLCVWKGGGGWLLGNRGQVGAAEAQVAGEG
jgi:hypothetical protein